MLKKLAGQTALYGLSSMLGRALNFLLVPFYTSVLLVGEFGVFTELYAYVAFLNVVYAFGMETTYFRFANKNKLNEKEIFNETQSFVLVLSIFISGILILFSSFLAELLNYPGKGNYIVWMALIMGIDAMTLIPFARLRQQGKAAYFAFAKLTNIGLNIVLNIFFLVLCKGIFNGAFLQDLLPYVKMIYHPSKDIEYIFIANFLANACMIPLLWKHFAEYRFRWSSEKLKPLFVYAYPLMFMGLAGMVNEVLDRILLKPLLPVNLYPGFTREEVLGIYGGCYKLSMFMTLAVQSFRYAADPFFFSKAEDKNAPEIFARVMNWFVAICGIMFLVISLYADLIGALLLRKEAYRTGLSVVPVLLMANLFLGIYYNLSIWYKITDRTYWGTWIGIGGAAFTVLGNIVLIPLFGYMGAAVTTLSCYLLMAVVSYKVGHRHFPVPYDLFSILILIGGAAGMVVLADWLVFSSIWLEHLLRLSFVTRYLVLLFFLKNTRFKKESLVS